MTARCSFASISLIRSDACPFVFVSTTLNGGPLDGTNVTHRLQRLLESAKLPTMRFHDLRMAAPR
jgi:hypothetical protein